MFFLFKLSGPMYRNRPSLNLCETKVTLPLLCHLGQTAGKEGMSRDLEKTGCLTTHYRSASATVVWASWLHIASSRALLTVASHSTVGTWTRPQVLSELANPGRPGHSSATGLFGSFPSKSSQTLSRPLICKNIFWFPSNCMTKNIAFTPKFIFLPMTELQHFACSLKSLDSSSVGYTGAIRS